MYLSKCTSSYSSNTWSSQDFPGNPRSHCRGMGSILVRGLRSHMGQGGGCQEKTRQTMIPAVFTCWLQITVPFLHGRLSNKYLSSIKDMSFLKNSTVKRIIHKHQYFLKDFQPLSNPCYPEWQLQDHPDVKELSMGYCGVEIPWHAGVYEESRRHNSGSSLAFATLLYWTTTKDSFSPNVI